MNDDGMEHYSDFMHSMKNGQVDWAVTSEKQGLLRTPQMKPKQGGVIQGGQIGNYHEEAYDTPS
eukprot:CAMPEP_0202980272 /NCGR_PEP_ID=MMETSP1396-20130829/86227_1 /ASSEMBLY_ACC=CAM_ASM_000872 /TAXON_ID= /ORGANISM="Pseudokeronopsis sp., Strain Brazil" /LENGTH=63 /DNA_ID=CAMNT_0049720141 /DNA_START=696 /DNA_END=887 /DNA_ORIENTATION=-